MVILTGAGQAFCAGLDMEHLATMNAHTPEENRRDSENMARVLRTLYDFPKPIIAAVNGPAIAGGMGLATIPDFTLAVPEAKFGYTEVRVGFVPAIAASFLLRQVGELRCRELAAVGQAAQGAGSLSMGPGDADRGGRGTDASGQCPGPDAAAEQSPGPCGR